MKLLIVIDQFTTGGGARVVSRLLDGFVESNHKVILATKLEIKEKMYPIPNEVSVTSFYSPGSSNAFGTLKVHLQGIQSCRKLIKEFKPDIVIAEMPLIFMWCYFASLDLNVPIVAHDHTSFMRKLKPLYNYIRFYLYEKADALVILTERDKKVLGTKFPDKKVIYNPLPFKPIDLSEKYKRKKAILCVGRFDVWEVKGFDIIIEIFAKIASKYNDWKLEFAGTGSENSVNYIKELVKNNGIEDKTIFHGQISNMKELYQQVSIFVLPSRVEGLPMSLMEAMSQGCACIAFEVGGATNEMITQGISGFVVPDGDIATFQEKLDFLMTNEDTVEAIGNNAIKESNKFALSKVTDQWNELINEVVHAKKNN